MLVSLTLLIYLTDLQVASCITLQKHVRGRQGRLQCISLKEAAKEHLRVTRAAAHKIERAWRNHRTRCKVHILKELQQMRLNVWHTAAMKAQACFRRWHCRSIIASKKFEQYKRWSSACHLQAHWRGYRQRMVYAMQLRRYRIIQEESAALRLQSAWRRYKVIILFQSSSKLCVYLLCCLHPLMHSPIFHLFDL